MFKITNRPAYRIIYNLITFCLFKVIFMRRNYLKYQCLNSNELISTMLIFMSVAEMSRSCLAENVSDVVALKLLKNKQSQSDRLHYFQAYSFLMLLIDLAVVLPALVGLVYMISKTHAFSHVPLWENIAGFLILFAGQLFGIYHVVYDCILSIKNNTYVRMPAGIIGMGMSLLAINYSMNWCLGSISHTVICIIIYQFVNMVITWGFACYTEGRLLLPYYNSYVVPTFKLVWRDLIFLGCVIFLKKLHTSVAYELFALITPSINHAMVRAADMISSNVLANISVPISMVLVPLLSKSKSKDLMQKIEKSISYMLLLATPAYLVLGHLDLTVIIGLFINVDHLSVSDFSNLYLSVRTHFHSHLILLFTFILSTSLALKSRYKVLVSAQFFIFCIQFPLYYLLSKYTTNLNTLPSFTKYLVDTLHCLILLLVEIKPLWQASSKYLTAALTGSLLGYLVFKVFMYYGLNVYSSAFCNCTLSVSTYWLIGDLFKRRTANHV